MLPPARRNQFGPVQTVCRCPSPSLVVPAWGRAAPDLPSAGRGGGEGARGQEQPSAPCFVHPQLERPPKP